MMKFKKILMIWKIAWQNPLKVNIGFHSLVYVQEKCRCLCTKTHGRQEKNVHGSPLCKSHTGNRPVSTSKRMWTDCGRVTQWNTT